MQDKMQEQVQKWIDTNKTIAEKVQKATDINANLTTSLVRQHVDAMNIFVESSSKQVQDLSAAKQVQDVWTIQSEALQAFNKQFINNARVTAEIVADSKSQFTTLVEETIKEISDLNPVMAKAAA